MPPSVGRFFVNIARLIGIVITGPESNGSGEYVQTKVNSDGALQVSDANQNQTLTNIFNSTSFTYTSGIVWDSFTYVYPSDTQEVITYYLNGVPKRIVTLNWVDSTKVRFASGSYVDL
jgi:hypothetical protein